MVTFCLGFFFLYSSFCFVSKTQSVVILRFFEMGKVSFYADDIKICCHWILFFCQCKSGKESKQMKIDNKCKYFEIQFMRTDCVKNQIAFRVTHTRVLMMTRMQVRQINSWWLAKIATIEIVTLLIVNWVLKYWFRAAAENYHTARLTYLHTHTHIWRLWCHVA